jgi:hypothetical protein
MRRCGPILLALATMLFWTAPATAQFQEGDAGGARLGESQSQTWQAGIIVNAASGPCRGIVGYAPLPIDWPEQQVRVVEEDITPNARVGSEMVEETVKLMVVRIRQLPPGQEARAVLTLEIDRHELLPPEDTDQYVLPNPRRLPRDIRKYLGPSPLIESRSPTIRSLAKQIGADEEKAWDRVEAIYDWVRNKVEYKNGPIKGALAALRDGTGDCEELTSLFIAICRAADIPARTVWVPDHCYPEFYLEDQDGEGHWFPCQAAGSRAFGGIPEFRPILQKGDNFSPPHDRRDRKRYLSEHLTGAGGRPQVEFVRELVSD